MNTPALADLYLTVDPTTRSRRVTEETELIVEGYPRSGNTYARAAFEYANGPEVRLSTHLHWIKSVQRGVARGIPTIVLVREPGEVLASVVQQDPTMKPARVLRGYRKYHTHLLKYLDDVVVGVFPYVVSDFGKVIEACNTKFGTAFTPYVPTPEAEAGIFRAIDEVALAHDPARFAHAVSRPSGERRTAAEILGELTPGERALLDRARSAYQQVLARCQRDAPPIVG